MSYIPISLNLNGQKIVVIGGGKVALQKLFTILLYSKEVKVVAPDILQEVKGLDINIVEKEYEPEDLDGCQIVYVCTNKKELNSRIRLEAKKRGLLVNVADSPKECDFISPAIYKEGEISIAVSSNATD